MVRAGKNTRMRCNGKHMRQMRLVKEPEMICEIVCWKPPLERYG